MTRMVVVVTHDVPRMSSRVFNDVAAERVRAHAKHSAKGRSAEEMPLSDPFWLPVLVEEVGEVARAMNDREPLPHLYAELVQVAAMATAMADAVREAYSIGGDGQ